MTLPTLAIFFRSDHSGWDPVTSTQAFSCLWCPKTDYPASCCHSWLQPALVPCTNTPALGNASWAVPNLDISGCMGYQHLGQVNQTSWRHLDEDSTETSDQLGLINSFIEKGGIFPLRIWLVTEQLLEQLQYGVALGRGAFSSWGTPSSLTLTSSHHKLKGVHPFRSALWRQDQAYHHLL